jgi:hypothetical protein
MENACLMGGMILIWLSLLGAVITGVAFATADWGDNGSSGATFTSSVSKYTDPDGYVCDSFMATDASYLCPNNPKYSYDE